MICQNCGATINQGIVCSNCGGSASNREDQKFGFSSIPPTPTTAGSAFSSAGIVFGIIGLFIIPILFGGIGIVFSAIAKSKGEAKANTALTISIVGTVAGVVIGAIVGASGLGL